MEGILRILFGLVSGIFMGGSVLRLFPAKSKWYCKPAITFILSTTFFTVSWVGDENPIILFPFFILAFFLFLQGENLAKIVVGGILFSMFIPVNMLFDSIDHGKGFHLLLLKTVLWLVLAGVLKRFSPKDCLHLPHRFWVLLGSLTLAPLTTILSFSLWRNNQVIESEYILYRQLLNRLAITMLPFAFISAMALLIAAVVLSKQEALVQENQMAALREMYYTGLKQEQIQLRTFKHDLHNHITALQGLLSVSNICEAENYLKELSDSPVFSRGKLYTENEIVNVVLSSKAQQMELAGITADFSVQLPKELPTSAPELCAIFGNALDNAMEGVANHRDKVIHLQSHVNKGMFMLRVENAIGGEVNQNLSTTKADRKSHGLGLACMREIACRYGGTLEATAENGRFELLICFPCVEAEKEY